MNKSKKLCVVGASGLVGSSIVRCALEKGYIVNGTLRDKNNEEKREFYNIPWSLNANYYLTYNKGHNIAAFADTTQSLTFSGNLKISKNYTIINCIKKV